MLPVKIKNSPLRGLFMWRNIATSVLLISSLSAQAAYQCSVRPQQDIVITPQSVEVTSTYETLRISPRGDVARNGKNLSLDQQQRHLAERYQQALRKDLPWIANESDQALTRAKNSLDQVINEQLGGSSQVHQRLTQLDSQLRQQLSHILEKRPDGWAFHHNEISSVEQKGQQLIQQAMGGMLQDSINELGKMKPSSASNGTPSAQNSNPLQALLGNLGGVQHALQESWKSQEQDMHQLGKQICQRAKALDSQYKTLITALPQ